jgi:hypothetical protein
MDAAPSSGTELTIGIFNGATGLLVMRGLTWAIKAHVTSEHPVVVSVVPGIENNVGAVVGSQEYC